MGWPGPRKRTSLGEPDATPEPSAERWPRCNVPGWFPLSDKGDCIGGCRFTASSRSGNQVPLLVNGGHGCPLARGHGCPDSRAWVPSVPQGTRNRGPRLARDREEKHSMSISLRTLTV